MRSDATQRGLRALLLRPVLVFAVGLALIAAGVALFSSINPTNASRG